MSYASQKRINSMLIQNDRVSCVVGGNLVTGRVCGKTGGDLPLLGGTYIIEPDQPIANEVYPYSHFTMDERGLTKL